MTMLFVLLSVALFASLDCRTVNIRNDCDYKVWVEGEGQYAGEVSKKDGPTRRLHITLPPKTFYTYDIPLNIDAQMFYPMTECETNYTYCQGYLFGKPTNYIHFFFGDARSDSAVDLYRVVYDSGYVVPIRVSPISELCCKSIICNVTLDDCPTGEINNVGDLRRFAPIVKFGSILPITIPHVMYCIAPCAIYESLNLNNEGRLVTCEDQPWKYWDMMVLKCPGSVSIKSYFTEYVYVEHTCKAGNSYDIVICP